MQNKKYNIIEFLILDDFEFIVNAIKQIYQREPSQSEIDEYLYNLRTGLSDKVNLLRLLRKSSEGIKNSPNIKGLFLFGALNRAKKFPFIGFFLKPLFYLMHVPLLINKSERNSLSSSETLAFTKDQITFIKDKINGLESESSVLNFEFAENKQKLVDLYLQIGRISRYNKRLENVLKNDISDMHEDQEELSSLLKNHLEISEKNEEMLHTLKRKIQDADNLYVKVQEMENLRAKVAGIDSLLEISYKNEEMLHALKDKIQEADNLYVKVQEMENLRTKVTEIDSLSEEIKEKIIQLDKFSHNNLEQLDDYENQLKSLSQHYHNNVEDLTHNLNKKIIRNQQLYEQIFSDYSKVVHDLNFLRNDSEKKFQTLSQRTEFIRKEILYEFKYSNKTEKQDDSIEIVNKRKYERKKKDIKINVGCGHLPLRGYLNIDKRKLPNVDIVTDALNLPFEKESISELFSAHLIEHFPEEELKRLVLPYWYSLIKKGGILKLTFPDFDTMAKKYIEEDYPFGKFREVIFGAQDYDGDFHFNLFTKESISSLLYGIGFREVDVPVVGILNGDCYEMGVVAKK